ncbi:MAG: hypothetical protein QM499_00965 [Flavobacteriaceae bacterium]
MDGAFSMIVTGTGQIDWGDGSALESYSTVSTVVLSHTYSSFDGDIKFYGTLTYITFDTLNSTIHHDISLLPKELEHYRLSKNNTVYGDIANLPSTLDYFLCFGANTTHGDIANLPSGLLQYYNIGLNEVSQYTAGHVFDSAINQFYSKPTTGFGLDTTEIDNLLIDLEASGMSTGTITLSGNNAPRSAASDTAVNSLVAKGVTVTTS